MSYDNPDEYWRQRLDEFSNNNIHDDCECFYIMRSENIIEIDENTYDLNELTDEDYDIICPKCNGIMKLDDND